MVVTEIVTSAVAVLVEGARVTVEALSVAYAAGVAL